MTWLARAHLLIERHEEKRTEVYDDATGKKIGPGTFVKGTPTVGIGHTGPLCEAAIQVQYDYDLQVALQDARSAFPGFDGLDDTRKAALLSMSFNLGLTRLSGFRKMLEALAHGRYDQAAAEMRDSLWATQVGHRAEELATMMEAGEPQMT